MHDHPTLSDVIAALNDGENARAEQLLEDLVDHRAGVGNVFTEVIYGIKVDPMPPRRGLVAWTRSSSRRPRLAWPTSRRDRTLLVVPGHELYIDPRAEWPRISVHVELRQLLIRVTAYQRRSWNYGLSHIVFGARALGGWDLPTMARPVKVIWPSWGIRR